MLGYLENTDTFLIAEKQRFCIVADGMGGLAAGELASRIFLETVVQVFQPANNPVTH